MRRLAAFSVPVVLLAAGLASWPAFGKSGRSLAGDGSLRGKLDMSSVTLADGRYSAALPGGRTAVLTLHPGVQEAAEAVLKRARAHRGAVVVMELDGRILALAGRDGRRRAPELAVQVWAPAASIFKIVTAAALIDVGVRPDLTVCYHGGRRSVNAENLRDDAKRDRACNDLAFAIARSQNSIVAKLTHRYLEPEGLRAVARAFGFDLPLDFALAAELGRTRIPTDDLAFARVSAGFWRTELSPLGGALIAATVASGGLAITPRIAEEIASSGDRMAVRPLTPRRVLPEHVARDLAHMMTGTTEYGTARKGFRDRRGRAFLPRVQVAGKTGTLTRHSPSYVQYSWFVGFAPANEPKIAISVLLGNPPRWHLKAHTAARIVLQKAL